MRAMASVVIPAHDEAAVIEGCLRRLAPVLSELEVVVVCNGCNDDTASRAQAFSGVQVTEIHVASKIAALNIGDEIATVMPRIYLDADVHIDVEDLQAVILSLATTDVVAAAPLPKVDVRGSSVLVRAYFAIWQRLGYVNHNVLGSGFYGLSAEGRRRFGAFPDVISDDGFVYSHFTRSERINPQDTYFTIRSPRTLRALYRRRVRIAQGTKQLALHGRRMDVPGPSWIVVLLKNPALIPIAPVFVITNLLAAVTAGRRLRRGTSTWNRDDSRQCITFPEDIGPPVK